jgi:flavin-dependent dehydrogenase
MELFDVIIIGGGPAGLKCAETLGKSDLRVLLLEKEEIFGDKLCAGGITLKDMGILPVPDEVIEHKISRASIHSRKRRADTLAPAPFLFTLSRIELGAYQRNLLDNTDVVVRTGSQVTTIESNKVILKDGWEYGFKYLVGAEGYNSLVRRYLNLPSPKKLIGFQYTIPRPEVDPVLHIFMDWRKFGSWYAWIFPHRESIAVGCCCDPDLVDHKKIKDHFHQWLQEREIDPGKSKLESYPISYGYHGVQFDHIFLVGEAAGLASGFTGEGIYQSLVSGQEVASTILDPAHDTKLLKEVIKYNRDVFRVWKAFRMFGPLKGVLHELLVFLMNRKWIRDKINSGFSN